MKRNKAMTGSVLVMLLMVFSLVTGVWGIPAQAAGKKTPAQTTITSAKPAGSGVSQVVLKWGKAANATSYHVYYRKMGTTAWTKLVSTAKTTYTHTGKKGAPLVRGSKYQYVVRTYNNADKTWGKTSKAVTVTIPVIPEVVTLKSLKAVSYNKTILTWNKAKNATAYRVYYKKSGAPGWTELATTKNTSYTHTSRASAPLKEKTTYLYTVRAYNNAGKTWSTQYAKAKSVKMPQNKKTVVPGEAKLSGYTATGHSITLTWKKATDATSYVLYGKKEKTDAWRILGNTDKTSFTVSSINGQDLASGTSYWFHICSYNKNSRKYGAFDSDGGMEASTDEVPATGIRLSTWDVTLTASHKTETIQAELIPADATAYEFEFQMDDPSIAEITAKQVNGNKASVTIKAKKNGNTALYIIHGGLAETCDVTVNTDIAVSSVKLNKTSLTFKKKGEQEKLTASIQPASATNQGVVWSSDNPKAVTVDANGTVTAVGPGTATITVTTKDGNKTASCQVTADITIPIESIKLNVGEVTLGRYGASETLHAAVYPAGAKGTLVWTSSNEQIATVDQQGKVTAVSTGNAVITVSTEDGSVSATCDALIEIDEPAIQVERVTLNHATASLTEKGETLQLTASLSPEDATEKTVLWKSSRPSCATVDGSGLVTAVSSGTATITAMAANGVSATCEITVSIDETVHVSSIQLNKATLSFTQKGASETLQAIILPSNADDQSVSWTSSNSSVAKVDQNGTVTAVADGTAIITAVANDGRKAATCSVTVKIPEETEKPVEGPTEETITLEGGKEDCLEVIQGTRVTDCSKITFECIGNSDIMEYSIEKTIRYADMTITGYKKGSIQVVAKYDGTVVKRWRVIFTSDWTDYWNYIAWRNSAMKEICPDGTVTNETPEQIKTYIKTKFRYGTGNGASNKLYAYQTMKCDCWGATGMFGDIAAAFGFKVGYVNAAGNVYETMSEAIAAGGAGGGSTHMHNVVWLNGQWVHFDAQPRY